MRLLRFFCLLLVSLCIVSCGGGGSSGTPGNPAPVADMNGNWELMATSTSFVDQKTIIGGHIDHTGTTVFGAIVPQSLTGATACFDGYGTVAVSGTVNRDGSSLSMTTQPLTGQVLTITGKASQDFKTVTGTYSIKGGCADGDRGDLSAWKVPPVTGTWKGTLTYPEPGTLTLNLTQRDEHKEGVTTVSGTATISGWSCWDPGVTTLNFGGILASNMLVEAYQSSGAYFDYMSWSNSTGNSLTGTFYIEGGSCPPVSFDLTLTKQ